MPELTVEGYGSFDVADGKRLVLALLEDAGVDLTVVENGRCIVPIGLGRRLPQTARGPPGRPRESACRKGPSCPRRYRAR